MSTSSLLNIEHSELGSFSTSHVQSITSELTNSQISSFCPVQTFFLSLCPARHLLTTKF